MRPKRLAELRGAVRVSHAAFGPDNDRNAALAAIIRGAPHGLAVFAKAGRIPTDTQAQRLDLLSTLFSNAPECLDT